MPAEVKKELEKIRVNASKNIPLRSLASAIIMMYIQEHPGMIQRELADNFHLRNASVTNMLKNLERDGYIQRKQDEKSARIKRIYITQLGEKQVIEMKKSFNLILKKLSSRVDEKLLDQLIPLLKELNQQVRNN